MGPFDQLECVDPPHHDWHEVHTLPYLPMHLSHVLTSRCDPRVQDINISGAWTSRRPQALQSNAAQRSRKTVEIKTEGPRHGEASMSPFCPIRTNSWD